MAAFDRLLSQARRHCLSSSLLRSQNWYYRSLSSSSSSYSSSDQNPFPNEPNSTKSQVLPVQPVSHRVKPKDPSPSPNQEPASLERLEPNLQVPFPPLIKVEQQQNKKGQNVVHDLKEAISLVKSNAKRNFDETLEAHVKLAADLRRTDLKFTGSVSLPHGSGKSLRVAVFAEGAAADEANVAGADLVGGEDLIEGIKNGASENFRGSTHVVDHAVPRLLRNMGMKLGFPQANYLPSTMKFASFIHSVGPKEFEKGMNNGSIDTHRNQASLDRNGNRSPVETERNSGPLRDFSRRLADINGNQLPPGNARPFEGLSRRLTDVDGNRPPIQFERNAGLSEGLFRRSADVDRSQPTTDIGRDARPFRRDAGPAESRRETSSMNFVRGIMKDNLSDIQSPRYGIEHNADIVHIKLMRNNTFVTVTDSKGNKKIGASAGCLAEMKGGPKVSKYAAEATAEHVGRIAKSMGLKSFVMKVNGFTFFKRKKLAILSFRDGYTHSRTDQNPIVYVEDTTRKPHNGCRLRKKRRV